MGVQGCLPLLTPTPHTSPTASPSRSSWSIGKGGELTEAAVREKAHEGRVTSLAWCKTGLVYSVSYDGQLKVGCALH